MYYVGVEPTASSLLMKRSTGELIALPVDLLRENNIFFIVLGFFISTMTYEIVVLNFK